MEGVRGKERGEKKDKKKINRKLMKFLKKDTYKQIQTQGLRIVSEQCC